MASSTFFERLTMSPTPIMTGVLLEERDMMIAFLSNWRVRIAVNVFCQCDGKPRCMSTSNDHVAC